MLTLVNQLTSLSSWRACKMVTSLSHIIISGLDITLKYGSLDEFKILVCWLNLKVPNVNHFSCFEFSLIGKIYLLEYCQNHFHGNQL